METESLRRSLQGSRGNRRLLEEVEATLLPFVVIGERRAGLRQTFPRVSNAS
jgi:hypothetical protein